MRSKVNESGRQTMGIQWSLAPAANARSQDMTRGVKLVIQHYEKNTPFFSRPNTETRFLLGLGASD
jgi:hypothetical protein